MIPKFLSHIDTVTAYLQYIAFLLSQT